MDIYWNYQTTLEKKMFQGFKNSLESFFKGKVEIKTVIDTIIEKSTVIDANNLFIFSHSFVICYFSRSA